MNLPPKVKKIWDIATTVIVVIFVVAAIFLMGARVIGYQVYNVISHSMEPTYSKGDLIYLKPFSEEAKASGQINIKVGDPISYVANEAGTVNTHRIVSIDWENQTVTTKGDANETDDPVPVHFKNIIGVVKFSIPLLGYVSDFIDDPPGTWYAIGGVVILLVIAFLPDITSKSKKNPDAQQSAEPPGDEPKEQ